MQENIVSIKLVRFGDASVKGYCAVIYLVCKVEYEFCSQLMCTKSRACPLGEITVPRLELIAANVLAHLIVNVKEALRGIPNFDQITCFGDNTEVLFWIKITREYKQFVRNRVKKIFDLTTREMWRYCPSHHTP